MKINAESTNNLIKLPRNLSIIMFIFFLISNIVKIIMVSIYANDKIIREIDILLCTNGWRDLNMIGYYEPNQWELKFLTSLRFSLQNNKDREPSNKQMNCYNKILKKVTDKIGHTK